MFLASGATYFCFSPIPSNYSLNLDRQQVHSGIRARLMTEGFLSSCTHDWFEQGSHGIWEYAWTPLHLAICRELTSVKLHSQGFLRKKCTCSLNSNATIFWPQGLYIVLALDYHTLCTHWNWIISAFGWHILLQIEEILVSNSCSSNCCSCSLLACITFTIVSDCESMQQHLHNNDFRSASACEAIKGQWINLTGALDWGFYSARTSPNHKFLPDQAN
jgi:hypothetical protein